MNENEIRADTLRKLAYFLESQENIGVQYDKDMSPEEREWWATNITPSHLNMLYIDDREDAWEWFHSHADLIEKGEWAFPPRLYEGDEPYFPEDY